MTTLYVILIVLACGAVGGFVNVFIGDSGLHLPRIENGVWRPGYIGTVVVGIAAALGAWATAKSAILIGPGVTDVGLSTGDIANALAVGFGGAKWWKSETEKDVLQRAAAIAADKHPDPVAATRIAVGSPFEALNTAVHMK